MEFTSNMEKNKWAINTDTNIASGSEECYEEKNKSG